MDQSGQIQHWTEILRDGRYSSRSGSVVHVSVIGTKGNLMGQHHLADEGHRMVGVPALSDPGQPSSCGDLKRPAGSQGAYADLLRDKGQDSTEAALPRRAGTGTASRRHSQTGGRRSFLRGSIGSAIHFGGDDWDYLYQMPYHPRRACRVADFIERVPGPDPGR